MFMALAPQIKLTTERGKCWATRSQRWGKIIIVICSGCLFIVFSASTTKFYGAGTIDNKAMHIPYLLGSSQFHQGH